jgi:hypothetical protein
MEDSYESSLTHSLHYLFSFLIIIVFFISCSLGNQNSSFSGQGITTDISNSLSTRDLVNYPYMGGSLFYNPDDPSSGAVLNNATIAVRLDKTKLLFKDDLQESYADIDEAAQYGYLHVTDVDSQKIAFDYRLFDQKGQLVQASNRNIVVGESADLDNDGKMDLRFAKPSTERPGLEKAVYLSFLCEAENQTTAMFSVVKTQYSRALYPSGLLGINPSGRFIVSSNGGGGASRVITTGIMPGDYIVDEATGEVSIARRNVASRALTDNDSTKIDTSSSDYGMFTAEEFTAEKTAIALCSALPDVIKAGKQAPNSEEEAIILLNQFLANRDLLALMASVCVTSIPVEELPQVYSDVSSMDADKIISFNRNLLYTTFPKECPEILPSANDVTQIIPYASCAIGNQDVEESSTSPSVSRALSVSDYNASSVQI